ncbi:MAG: 16S rRNA (cytosine(1402)-N(4))-methyltransferase RsmH [Firmicutes bacterium]|nr:16S rRNA (cytosine(1402)-N(4))-methyltransferase RsmH [Bacillota bacterium]
MTYGHRPVMLEEAARIIDAGPGAVYVDATVGFGGHAERLAEMTGPGGRVVGVDRDPEALAAASRRLERFGDRVTLVHARFSRLDEVLRERGIGPVQGLLFDLGVSSFQLDEPGRGFTYWGSAPLDMRMDPTEGGPTAADLLRELDKSELCKIFREYGEERWASRIAAFVVEARRHGSLRTADELAEVVRRAVPASARREGGHPARRVFQALRIAVNRELEELEAALGKVPSLLAPGGRVVVIAYHSLEDRLVKSSFRDAERGCRCPPGLPECRCGSRPTLRVLTRRPLTPRPEETLANPRARSAKLRAAERLPA